MSPYILVVNKLNSLIKIEIPDWSTRKTKQINKNQGREIYTIGKLKLGVYRTMHFTQTIYIHHILSKHKTHTKTGIDLAIKGASKNSKEINQIVFSDGEIRNKKPISKYQLKTLYQVTEMWAI